MRSFDEEIEALGFVEHISVRALAGAKHALDTAFS
jgi:hypothetical protein